MALKAKIKNIVPKRILKVGRKVYSNLYCKLKGLQTINTKYEISCIGHEGIHSFFGYYDISPFDSHNNIIYLEVDYKKEDAKIMLYSMESQEYKIVTSTKAWNTQQGSRLRWLPNTEEWISFNDYKEGKYINRHINIKTLEEKVIPYPLYDISQNGKFGITLNFARLGVLRPGYGYTNYHYIPSEDLTKEDIKIVNLSTREVISTISYDRISKTMGEKVLDFSDYYINHLSFSPSGNKFLFFWLKDIPNSLPKASLLVYDIEKDELYVLENELRVSHYTWVDNETILCTAVSETEDKTFKCQYYMYKKDTEKVIVGKGCLQTDGHPSLYNEQTILSDTYPDRYSYQELFLYNIETNEKRQLVYSKSVPVRDSIYRTDLHPRFNLTKDVICYDANVDGFRKIFILKNWN